MLNSIKKTEKCEIPTLSGKTPKIKIEKKGIAIFLALFIMVAAGCSKEEMSQPSAEKTAIAGADLRQADNPPPPVARPFEMIRIDHQSGRSFYPDYSIAVLSDGTVQFVGRRNTSTLGKVSFSVDESTMKLVRFAFEDFNFYGIRSERNFNPDVPRVLTSFAPDKNAKIKTLADDHHNPGRLINLRKTVEWILQIDRFVIEDDVPIGR